MDNLTSHVLCACKLSEYLGFCSNSLALLLVLRVQRPRKAYPVELAQFHSEEYIDFLAKVSVSPELNSKGINMFLKQFHGKGQDLLTKEPVWARELC